MSFDKSEDVYRRGRVNHQNPDGSPTSRVFKPRPVDREKLSVDIKSLTTLQKSLKDGAMFFLCEGNIGEIQAVKNIQSENLQVMPDILEDNEAHALIVRISDDDD